MNHSPLPSILAAVMGSAALLAQDRATTLTTLSQRAAVVVRATVVADSSPSPELRQLTLRNDQLLHGTLGATFTLTEPAGRCCGRALFALQVGDARVLFLDRVGPTLHVRGGGRGVLPVTAPLTSHVQQLLAAEDDTALAHLLAANLDHDEPRIRDDAADALATLPQLQLNAAERGAVITALSTAVLKGSVRTAALADIVARLGDDTTVDAVLPIYLEAQRDDQARLLQQALCRLPAAQVGARLPAFVGRSRRGNLRAARLLVALPSAAANAAMADLLQRADHPQVQLQLCEGLLSAGTSRATLAPMVPPVVLDLAAARIARRPTFRNIDPRR